MGSWVMNVFRILVAPQWHCLHPWCKSNSLESCQNHAILGFFAMSWTCCRPRIPTAKWAINTHRRHVHASTLCQHCCPTVGQHLLCDMFALTREKWKEMCWLQDSLGWTMCWLLLRSIVERVWQLRQKTRFPPDDTQKSPVGAPAKPTSPSSKISQRKDRR